MPPTPIVLVHFQRCANHLTKAQPVYTWLP